MIKYILPVSFAVLWEIASRYLGYYFFPPPSAAIVELYNQILHGPVLSDTLISIGRLVVASLIAIPLVLVLGLYIGYNPFVRKLFDAVVNIARAVPTSALIPIVILIAGLTYKSSVILLVYAVAVPMLILTIDSISYTTNTYKPLIENLELSIYDAFTKVLIPGSLPGILSGIDTGITIAFKFLIIVEVFGSSGLGYRIGSSTDQLAYVTSYALLIWISFLGLALFGGLNWVKQRILHWL